MDRIKDMLVGTIEDFRKEVPDYEMFDSIFEELLEDVSSDEITIKGDIKSCIAKAIENCKKEIAYEQDMIEKEDEEDVYSEYMENIDLYLSLKIKLTKLQSELKEVKNTMDTKSVELFNELYEIVEDYILDGQTLELDSLNEWHTLFTLDDGSVEIETFEECIDGYIDFATDLSKDNIDVGNFETAQVCLGDVIKLKALKEKVKKATESPYSTELREFKEYVDNKVGELIESEELDEYDLELKFCDKKLNVWISPEMLEDLYELIDNQIELY